MGALARHVHVFIGRGWLSLIRRFQMLVLDGWSGERIMFMGINTSSPALEMSKVSRLMYPFEGRRRVSTMRCMMRFLVLVTMTWMERDIQAIAGVLRTSFRGTDYFPQPEQAHGVKAFVCGHDLSSQTHEPDWCCAHVCIFCRQGYVLDFTKHALERGSGVCIMVSRGCMETPVRGESEPHNSRPLLNGVVRIDDRILPF